MNNSILNLTLEELTQHIDKYADLLHKPHTIPNHKPKCSKYKKYEDAQRHAKMFYLKLINQELADKYKNNARSMKIDSFNIIRTYH